MATSTLVIPQITSELPQSTPNLMPFHINYTGPADVSTFMRVERYQPLQNVNASAEETSKPVSEEAELAISKSNTTEDVEMKTETEMDPPTLVTETHTDDVEMQTVGGTSESQSTLVESTSAATLAESQQDSQTSIHLPLESKASSSSFIGDTSKRFVSFFRGRTIHGIEVSLPEGYTGLVLKSDNNLLASTKEENDEERSSKPKQATRLTAKKKGKAKAGTVDDEDNEMEGGKPKPKPRPRGRLARSAIPTKEVVAIPSDSEPEDHTALSPPTPAADAPPEDNNPIKNLTPISQFSSFTLWQPDRPVDTSRDEYFRSLNEWIGLAQEIHRTDLDVTA